MPTGTLEIDDPFPDKGPLCRSSCLVQTGILAGNNRQFVAVHNNFGNSGCIDGGDKDLCLVGISLNHIIGFGNDLGFQIVELEGGGINLGM